MKKLREISALVFILIMISLFVSPMAAADFPKKEAKENCKVSLVKEGTVGSILLSFEADNQEQCERINDKDLKATFSGEEKKDEKK